MSEDAGVNVRLPQLSPRCLSGGVPLVCLHPETSNDERGPATADAPT